MLADVTRKLPITDPEGRELRISCGASLLNFRVAMSSFGCHCDIIVHPEAEPPHALAEATFTGHENGSEPDRRLRDAITARRTNRGEFESRALPTNVLEDLSTAAQRENAGLTLVTAASIKSLVVNLVGEAEKTLLARPQYQNELGRWVHQRVSESTVQSSVRRESAAGHLPEHRTQPDLAILSAANAARTFPPGEEAFARHKGHLAAAPVLALVTTDSDKPADWFATGQAMQRILLTATEADVSASFLNPPIEVPELRTKLADLFETKGVPQILLRFGYGPNIPPTPRRPVGDIID
jgi:hypothetical protein